MCKCMYSTAHNYSTETVSILCSYISKATKVFPATVRVDDSSLTQYVNTFIIIVLLPLNIY